MLRIIACIIIVVFHYYFACKGTVFFNNKIIILLISNGGLLVGLFFMISGFCIAHGYKNRLLNKEISIQMYFQKHYLKFFCLSLVTLPAAVIKQYCVNHAGLDSSNVNIVDILRDVFLIRYGWGHTVSMPYNGPLWFVMVLMIMYIAYYLLCCFNKEYYKFITILIILLGIFLHYEKINYLPIICEANAIGFINFFLGVLLFDLYSFVIGCKKKINLLTAVMLVLLVATLIAKILSEYNLCHKQIVGNTELVLSLIIWPTIIWIAINYINFCGFWGRLVGKMSNYTMPIFSIHHPIIWIIVGVNTMTKAQINIGTLKFFICYILIVIVAAVIINLIFSKIFKFIVNFLN